LSRRGFVLKIATEAYYESSPFLYKVKEKIKTDNFFNNNQPNYVNVKYNTASPILSVKHW
jgi:hypothetical protein